MKAAGKKNVLVAVELRCCYFGLANMNILFRHGMACKICVLKFEVVPEILAQQHATGRVVEIHHNDDQLFQ